MAMAASVLSAMVSMEITFVVGVMSQRRRPDADASVRAAKAESHVRAMAWRSVHQDVALFQQLLGPCSLSGGGEEQVGGDDGQGNHDSLAAGQSVQVVANDLAKFVAGDRLHLVVSGWGDCLGRRLLPCMLEL